MKTINKKQSVGLFYVGFGTLVGVTSGHMPEDYGCIMTVLAVLFLFVGVFFMFKYKDK